MVVEFQNPDVVDPFEGYSVLSLLPRTFRDLKKTGNSDQDNMESIHNYLKSQALKSPNKILEQAKIILQSSSENQNSEFPCHVQPEDKGKNTSTLGKDRPQERRPALGRKRAKFSLKPNASQLSLDEDTSLDISQFQDPEDFFSAFEKLENAKKELQKQRGEISTNSIQHNRSARTRRPGILGRKVGYTHRYSSVLVNGDEAIAPSQGMFEMDSPGPSNSGINMYQHETLQERELAGDGCMNTIQDSVANTENRVDTLLDELLSANTDLDGDGAFTFLQERLQIKPIKLDNLCLPDLDGIRRSAFKTSVDQFTRPRKALSDIHNMITQVKDMHREVVASKELELGVEGLTMGSLHCSASQLDNPDPTSGEHHPMDGHSEIVDILPGQNNEVGQNEDMLPGQNTEVSQIVDILPGQNEVGHFVSQNTEVGQNNEVGQNEDILPRQNAEISQIVGVLPGQNEKPSGMSANEHGKQKVPTHNRRKRKELSNRKSLAGAGTVWESGVRRSSRIKMRPLEFWRGERFLYGRVHDTLLTVIGVKYGSPAKGDGKTTLKVESFVSDEYKELVEKAALH